MMVILVKTIQDSKSYSANKLFLSDHGKLSRRLLSQPPRQFTLAPEQGR